jgi:hypothetical protein
VIATREFVFVHVQKTGGEFLRDCIRETMEVRFEGVHTPYADLPAQFRGLPAITFKRNPWDWYVSLWLHRQREGFREGFDQFVISNFWTSPDWYTRIFWEVAGRLGARAGLVEKGRTESLRDDFIAFLDRHEIANGDLRAAVRESPPANVSPGRKHYRDYYSQATAHLVGTSRMARGYEF